MKRRNTESLKDVIYQYLRLQGLETPLNEVRAIKAWPEVAGAAITRYTTDVQIRNSTLYVKVTRPALRQDLMMMRTNLCQKINEKVGANVIQSIVFY